MPLIVKEKDRIDVVINNAGYALVGAFKETSIDEIKTQFETNFWSYKTNASSNTYNEKAKKWQNSKHNVYGGRKNCNSSCLYLPWN